MKSVQRSPFALTPGGFLARQRLIDRGLLKPAVATASLDWAAPMPRLLKSGSSQELLDADREERL